MSTSWTSSPTQRFRAVAVSLRGHGASTLSQPLNSCSIADYVDDVRATVDMLGAEPVLIGHSMGCFVVQKYLEKRHAPAAVLMASMPSRAAGGRPYHLRMIASSSMGRVARLIRSAAPPTWSTPRPDA